VITLNGLAAVGFASAGVAYLGLALLLLVRQAPAGAGRLLIAALLGESAWAIVLAAMMSGARLPAPVMGAVEALRVFLWIAFLLSLLRTALQDERPDAPLRRATNSGLIAAATLFAATFGIEVLAFGERAAFVVKLVGAVYGLVCLEQVYRNSPANRRWALKFMAIGLLALFGFDLLLYAEALLFSRLNGALWIARGYANALVMPLIAISAARNRTWKLDIAVSRGVVFHTATLMAAGLFLVLMAGGGYWIRYFGGDWGAVAEALMLFGAVITLMVVMMSGTLRARAKVFLAKNFFSYRYDYRAEWLKLTELLSSGHAEGEPAEPLETRAIRGLAALVESQGGALWQAADGGGFACAARWKFHGATPDVPAAAPLVEFLRTRQWVISLPEWRAERIAYEGLELPTEFAADDQNWLIVPLMLHEDLAGFVVLVAPLAPSDVNWEVRDALKAAARQIASYLGVRRAVEALVQARQFESFNRMSAFVVHDLKNLVAQLSLLTANAARHRDNPEFQQDMIDTVENVLGRMQGLLLQLRAGTKPIEKPAAVPVVEVLGAAIRSKRALKPVPALAVEEELQDAAVNAHRDRLERVVGHLVQNAAEATRPDGNIWVRLKRAGEGVVIEIEDTGKGMSEQFVREQLFKPFQSTKEHGMGIGTFESREYIRELGGTLEVSSAPGRGTVFRIRLPRAVAAAAA